MNIHVQKTNLVDAIRKCAFAVENKVVLPIYQFISLEAEQGDGSMTVRSGSLSTQVSAVISCQIEQDGAILLPAKKLLQICASLPEDDVQIIVTDNDKTRAMIKSGKAQYKIMGTVGESFPEPDAVTTSNCLTMPASAFLDGMRSVGFAKSTDPNRKQLNGVLLSVRGDTLSFVGTDGRRLAIADMLIATHMAGDENANGRVRWALGQEKFEGDIIIPASFMATAMKGLSAGDVMTIAFGGGDGGMIAFEMENPTTGETHCVATKTVEGSYPNYKQVVPSAPMSDFNVSRRSFLESLSRTTLVMATDGHGANVRVCGGDMTIFMSDAMIGDAREIVQIEDNGNDAERDISFNPLFAIEALKATDVEKVNVAFNDANTPIVFTDGLGWKMVMMPMRA